MVILKKLSDRPDAEGNRYQDRRDTKAKHESHKYDIRLRPKDVRKVAWEKKRNAAGCKQRDHPSEEGGNE